MDRRLAQAELVHAVIDRLPHDFHLVDSRVFAIVLRRLIDKMSPALQIQSQGEAKEGVIVPALKLPAENIDVDRRGGDENDGDDQNDADEDQPSSLSSHSVSSPAA